MRKAKTVPVTIPQYDYATQYRGPMTLLADGKKTLTLSDWPKSLMDAYKAGVLTGTAAAEAKQWIDTGRGVPPTPRRHPIHHPWNMALKNYRAVTDRVASS